MKYFTDEEIDRIFELHDEISEQKRPFGPLDEKSHWYDKDEDYRNVMVTRIGYSEDNYVHLKLPIDIDEIEQTIDKRIDQVNSWLNSPMNPKW